MLYTGLVSVTFRQLAPERIIQSVQAAGLAAIEWGGDIHVPHGDLQQAARVARLCREAGIRCCSYGSYCRLTDPERQSGEFEKVIATAQALGTRTIRVWAGAVDSQAATAGDFTAITANARYFTALASRQGIRTAYEYHGGTLTSTCGSAGRLLQAVPGSGIYWQPPQGAGQAQCLAEIAALMTSVVNIHVFSWEKTGEGIVRLPLCAKAEQWVNYLRPFAALPDEYGALLEFVAGDSEDQFMADAAELQRLVANCQTQ